jgi:hypothetical protein
MNKIQNIIAISNFVQKLLIAILFSTLPISSISAQEPDFDTLMREYGMVDIQELDPNILVELKYSTEDNFVGKDMYGDLERAYLEKEFANIKPTVEGAEKLGEAMGKRLAEKKITTVVFDRNGYLYHGVVKALADGARKAGIVF